MNIRGHFFSTITKDQGHHQRLRKIIYARLITKAGDSAWSLAIPLMLVELYPNSFLPATCFQFVLRSCLTLFMPIVGRFMDRTDRLKTVKYGIIAQIIGVIGTGFTPYLYTLFNDSYYLIPLIFLNFFGSLGIIGFNATFISVQHDWVPAVADKSSLTWLNSRIQQSTLFCEVIIPLIAGILLSLGSPLNLLHSGFGFLLLVNIISFIPEYFFLKSVYISSPNIRKLKDQNNRKVSTGIIKSFIDGWKALQSTNQSLLIIGYSLLWITALTPHNITLITYIVSEWKLSDSEVGFFRGFAAFFGILPSFFIYKLLVKSKLHKIITYFVLFQAFNLLVSATLFSIPFNQEYLNLKYLALLFIMVSRFGLNGIDLLYIQIRQENIEESIRSTVAGFSASLNHFGLLFMTAISLIFHKPEQFYILGWISFGSVLSSSILIKIWSINFKPLNLNENL